MNTKLDDLTVPFYYKSDTTRYFHLRWECPVRPPLSVLRGTLVIGTGKKTPCPICAE